VENPLCRSNSGGDRGAGRLVVEVDGVARARSGGAARQGLEVLAGERIHKQRRAAWKLAPGHHQRLPALDLLEADADAGAAQLLERILDATIGDQASQIAPLA